MKTNMKPVADFKEQYVDEPKRNKSESIDVQSVIDQIINNPPTEMEPVPSGEVSNVGEYEDLIDGVESEKFMKPVDMNVDNIIEDLKKKPYQPLHTDEYFSDNDDEEDEKATPPAYFEEDE